MEALLWDGLDTDVVRQRHICPRFITYGAESKIGTSSDVLTERRKSRRSTEPGSREISRRSNNKQAG